MFDLLKSTKARFEGDATLAALGTLRTKHVPPNTALPYATQSIVASGVLDSFGTRHVESTDIQFSIRTNALSTLVTYFNACKARFDRMTPVATDNGFLISAQRTSQHIDEESSGTDKNGDPVYLAWMRYRFQVDRSF